MDGNLCVQFIKGPQFQRLPQRGQHAFRRRYEQSSTHITWGTELQLQFPGLPSVGIKANVSYYLRKKMCLEWIFFARLAYTRLTQMVEQRMGARKISVGVP